MSFHELRHTFGTRCAAAGVAMRTIQAWMGAKDPDTTAIYAHYQPAAGEVSLVDRAFASATAELTAPMEVPIRGITRVRLSVKRPNV